MQEFALIKLISAWKRETMKNIANRIRQVREKYNRTHEEFGEWGGVKKRTQFNYESDSSTSAPDANYFESLYRNNVSIDDIIYIITSERHFVIKQDSADYDVPADQRAKNVMRMVVEVQDELDISLSATQLQILIGYAYDHALTKDSLTDFAEAAIQFARAQSTDKVIEQ